jgi:hypothetical protein
MTQATKIGYDQYLKMLRDPNTPDEEIVKYSVVTRGAGAFSPELRANPKLVLMAPEDREFESAMQVGNGIARFRRQLSFKRRLASGERLPVLVSEGDSWFQFPLLIDEVIDQLGRDYLIWCVSAAGDTLENMVNSAAARGKTEYLLALQEQKERVRAFLFSAAGNDIIGEDPTTGKPVLLDLLRPFNGNPQDITGHIDLALLDRKIAFLRTGYSKVIAAVRAQSGFAKLPILIHGYDYTFPYPWGAKDPRKPKHAAKNEWLGSPLDERGIKDQDLRRNIVKHMLDALYDMLHGLAGQSAQTHIHVVDCRGAMPDVHDWADEIHGTSAGFAKVAERFRAVLTSVV